MSHHHGLKGVIGHSCFHQCLVSFRFSRSCNNFLNGWENSVPFDRLPRATCPNTLTAHLRADLLERKDRLHRLHFGLCLRAITRCPQLNTPPSCLLCKVRVLRHDIQGESFTVFRRFQPHNSRIFGFVHGRPSITLVDRFVRGGFRHELSDPRFFDLSAEFPTQPARRANGRPFIRVKQLLERELRAMLLLHCPLLRDGECFLKAHTLIAGVHHFSKGTLQICREGLLLASSTGEDLDQNVIGDLNIHRFAINVLLKDL